MICTVTDRNYLAKALCLYESLDYPITVLCLDEYTYDKLKDLKPYGLTAVDVKGTGLERNKEIMYCNKNGSTYPHYCWSLSSTFPLYLMKNRNVDWVCYIDADVYFYKSFKNVLTNIENQSIGFTPHLVYDKNSPLGKFNVGVCYFKNDKMGNQALELWEDCVINPGNKFREEYGTLGDQKYIDLLWETYKPHFKSLDIKHGAPYLFEYYDNQKDYEFIHFMKFKILEKGYDWVYDVKDVEWADGKFIYLEGVKEIYDDYYEKTLEVISKYEI